ncbi:hypothetical protein J5X84_03360 [Streptosporangiaceae bacterium NEAU-GS5]|nr:hypothetical protein [Streptosporangiaceae bacterium NEAU-GS5]
MVGRHFDRARRPSAGGVLAVVSAVPALAVAGWLLAGLPLLLLGWFGPLPMAVTGLAAIALLCVYGLGRLPETVEAGASQTAAVVAIAVASGVFNGFFRGEQLIVRRDPATYAQYAIWIAEHGSLPIPYGDFGGADPALRFDSMGFYDYHGAVVPQFMAGPPILHAAGHWLGGVPGLLLAPPVLGALAVLVVAGTAARLAGGRWAPLAALLFAVCQPILYTSRTTFSEIPSVILLFGGLSLLLDARARLRVPAPVQPGLDGDDPALSGGQSERARLTAALAGFVFGMALLVRIDGLRDVLPVLAYGGFLIAARRAARRHGAPSAPGPRPRAARLAMEGALGPPLIGGLAVGGLLGFLACYLLARPYLNYLGGSLRPLLAIAAAVLVLTVAGAVVAARSSPASGDRVRRAADVVAALVVLGVIAFAVRPWVETVRRMPATPEDRLTAEFIGKTQLANGLPFDPARLYAEDTLYWVIWYVGLPVLVAATFAAVVIVRRLGRGRGFGWLLPLAIIGWTTATTLWRPAITPDQPFASRRLVPVVIPGLILLAVWALRWARDRLQRSGYGSRLPVAGGALLLLAPVAITSIGTAFTPVDRGEADAVARMCAAIPDDATVLIVERVTGDRFTQLVRGQCGVPAARVAYPAGADVPREADVRRMVGEVRATGRRPILLAAERAQVAPYGPAAQVLRLRTRQDERSLTSPPDGTWSLSTDVWMAEPAAP